MIVGKEFTFDSAHKLENYNGKCSRLHGHTYKVQISIKESVQENGLALDTKDLKSIINNKVINVLDHMYLNDIIRNPSMENISIWIWEQLKDYLPLYEIKLWETPTSFVVYSGV